MLFFRLNGLRIQADGKQKDTCQEEQGQVIESILRSAEFLPVEIDNECRKKDGQYYPDCSPDDNACCHVFPFL
jgi:hypothetical protein